MELVQIVREGSHETLFGIRREDGSTFEIGNWSDVCMLHSITADLDKYKTGGVPVVMETDPTLMQWVSIGDAVLIAIEEYGWPNSCADRIRQNARRGNFRTVKDASGRFRIERRSFVAWMDEKYATGGALLAWMDEKCATGGA